MRYTPDFYSERNYTLGARSLSHSAFALTCGRDLRAGVDLKK